MSVTSLSESDFDKLSEKGKLKLLKRLDCPPSVTIGDIHILLYSILYELYDVTRWYFEVGGDPNAKCVYEGESTSIFRMLMNISTSLKLYTKLYSKYIDLFLEYNVNIDGVISQHYIIHLVIIHVQVRRLPNLYKYYKNPYDGPSLINTLYIYYSKNPSYEKQFIEDILGMIKCGFNPFSREESLMRCGNSNCKSNHSLIYVLFTGGSISLIKGISPELDIRLNADILFDYSINSKNMRFINEIFDMVGDFLTTDSIRSIREIPTVYTQEKQK